jgi:hypothetical protein
MLYPVYLLREDALYVDALMGIGRLSIHRWQTRLDRLYELGYINVCYLVSTGRQGRFSLSCLCAP